MGRCRTTRVMYATYVAVLFLVAATLAATSSANTRRDNIFAEEYDSVVACDAATTILETVYAGANASAVVNAAYFSNAVQTLEASVYAICSERIVVSFNWTGPEDYYLAR